MLLTMMFGAGLTSAAALFASRRRHETPAHQMAAVLWALIGALIVYLYFQLELPGSAGLYALGNWAAIITTIVGGAAGFFLYQLISTRS